MDGYQIIAHKLGLIPEGFIKGGNLNEDLAEKLDQIENELAEKRKLKNIAKPPIGGGSKPRKI